MIAIAEGTCPAANAAETEAFLSVLPVVEGTPALYFEKWPTKREKTQSATWLPMRSKLSTVSSNWGNGKSPTRGLWPGFLWHAFGPGGASAPNRTQRCLCSPSPIRGGFRLEHLHSASSLSGDWAEILTDDTITPIPDQVAFRLDFRDWLKRQHRRDRKLALFLAWATLPPGGQAIPRVDRAGSASFVPSCVMIGPHSKASNHSTRQQPRPRSRRLESR